MAPLLVDVLVVPPPASSRGPPHHHRLLRPSRPLQIFGFVPLLAYIIFYGAKYEDGKGQLGICAAVTLLALFALGALQAWIIKQSIVKQGLLMMVNGGVAAASAYLIGWGLRVALDVKEGEC